MDHRSRKRRANAPAEMVPTLLPVQATWPFARGLPMTTSWDMNMVISSQDDTSTTISPTKIFLVVKLELSPNRWQICLARDSKDTERAQLIGFSPLGRRTG